MRSRILAAFFILASPLLIAQQTLNNDAVIKLAKAGLSDDLILTTINASPGSYDTSANGLIALKTAGVSDKVIAALVVKASGGAPANAPSGDVAGQPMQGVPPGIDSVGVYYLDTDHNVWEEVPAEVVNFKTGGAVKHIATVGIIKEDMNGLVNGSRARLVLHVPASFIFYVPEGRSPGEYQLLRLRLNNGSREFRSSTGGVVHESGGAMRDTVDYMSKKLAPRIYQITLGADVGRGEFGFLPPLDASSANNIASSGKIYSFALVP
ncbi:MAG TPA: hypothetical protein VKR52_12205 [Terracidiphilus sp.]|nr:hypothetical protein [Terracidiphilus sp.]